MQERFHFTKTKQFREPMYTMNSGRKCKEKDCRYFRSAKTNYCSQHTPEGIARLAARNAAIQAEENARQRRFNAMKPRWEDHARKLPVTRTRLVLGAVPHEERHGRTHYDDPNTFLLGNDEYRKPDVDYSRYILCDFTNEREVADVAAKYPDFFDEIAFDGSTMCGFRGNLDKNIRIFGLFYTMLHENGVLYSSDCDETKEALLRAGFRPVLEVRLSDLQDTLVDTLFLQGDRPTYVRSRSVPLGIKTTGGVGAPVALGVPGVLPSGGKRHTRRRRRRTIRRRRLPL